MNPVHWHVAPRYTTGSPAQVDEATGYINWRGVRRDRSADGAHFPRGVWLTR